MALNHAVAVALSGSYRSGLALVDALEPDLAGYHLWHAARADLLRRLGRVGDAIVSYRRAHALASNTAELRFLARRLEQLGATPLS